MFQPKFTISDELLRLVTQATELRSWIGQAVVDVVWLPKLQTDTAARMAHSSTAIEGNPLTLPEVEALARGEEVGPRVPQAKAEVQNYLAAMRWIWSQKADEPIVEQRLLDVHRLLTRGLLPADQVGRYKTKPNRIVDAKGRTIYVPPAPEQSRPLTRELLSWMAATGPKVHAIIVAAVAHHRLVSIHPFADGNGRIARALEAWLLYTRGFDTHHLFALDEFFWNDRERYYEKIQQARELDDDLSYWLEYLAEGVVDTLRRTQQRIESLQVAAKAPRIRLTKRQEDVLRLLRDRGRLRSPDIEKAFGLTRARVAQILGPLRKAGLMVREGRTRATSYRLA